LKNSILLLLISIGLLGSSAVAQAQTYNDSLGFYGQFSLPVGWNNMADDSGDGAMVGFALTAGYRFNSWIGADVEVLWMGAGDIRDPATGSVSMDASLLSVVGSAKFYPLVLTSRYIPGWVQPYLVFGLGSGIAQQSPRGSNQFGASQDETVFLARFGTGLEVMISQHWGTYLDVNYYAANSKSLSGIGTLRLGVLCHF
jgi:opacity protein-like surface antigen